MAATVQPRPATAEPAPRTRALRDLDHPADVISNITPNWFAAVMGTGIVATAAVSLPVQITGLHTFAFLAWMVAAALLVTLSVLTALHWVHHRETARSHHLNPVMSHFYGAPPMAMMTVGAGALLLGRDVLGLRLAVDIDWVLWFAGTICGLATSAVVPYLMFTRHRIAPGDAFGGWLMPVVPPMVSASGGALLAPHAPAGQARLTLIVSCYAMFGLSLLASIVIITLVWYRLAVHDIGPARMVPTLWIVLGPLGQSITAVNLLGVVAVHALPKRYGAGLDALAVVYGIPVWGFAMLWIGLATAMTVRVAREHLPFSLTWWSFTFPVGTFVTGTSELALHTGSDLFRYGAVVSYVGLVLAWLVVASRTARGCFRGWLFLRV
ncbi:MAG: TDT family transporter [Jatrophihabitantaceae bacterium]